MTVDERIAVTQEIRDAVKELGKCRAVFLRNCISHKCDRVEYEAILAMLVQEGVVEFSKTEFDTLLWVSKGTGLKVRGTEIQSKPYMRQEPETRTEYLGYWVSKTANKRNPWAVEFLTRHGKYITLRELPERADCVAWIETRQALKRMKPNR